MTNAMPRINNKLNTFIMRILQITAKALIYSF